ALLSMKEAFRGRILWVFSGLGLVILFGLWFIPSKPEEQVKDHVDLFYTTMAILVLLAGSLLAAFSIPTDVSRQTIHTVLTKPVERYEVVIGRFLGYTALMTAVLGVMTGVSLFFLLRGVTNPDAEYESLKARVPVTGTLEFEGTAN